MTKGEEARVAIIKMQKKINEKKFCELKGTLFILLIAIKCLVRSWADFFQV